MSTQSSLKQTEPLHHGGRLRAAAAEYGIALSDWLDLSTGINPNGWPVPDVPASSWARLPEAEDGLEQAARDYYGCKHLLAVAGSQAAIQALPQLRGVCNVSVLQPGYAEHAVAWQRAGHRVTPVTVEQLNDAAAHADVLVLIHPNNPTGARFSLEQLHHWHTRLAMRGGWLVVDEAFMDCTPEHSLAPYCAQPGLIVLRSLGKFFGLAGARLGFVCAHPDLLAQLHVLLGPWSVNGPTRWVATAALQDYRWHEQTRQQLADDGARLHALLTQFGLPPNGGCALFQWSQTPQAAQLHNTLARRGVLTRLFGSPNALRVGLPADESQWQRLEQVLAVTPNIQIEER